MAGKIEPRTTNHEPRLSFYRKIKRFIWRKFVFPFISPQNKTLFLLHLPRKAKLLDVGCGNHSPEHTKKLCPDIYYVGVDVCDYNNDEKSKTLADKYIMTSGENFAETIKNLPDEFDAAVSNHNLEHCNHPMETLDAICSRLKKGGKLYLAFPSEKSVTFPSRKGSLNFYDDGSHVYLPDFKAVIKRLIRNNGMSIDFAEASYMPFLAKIIGMFQNRIIRDRATYYIWCYYGFETIITAHKK